MYSYEDRMRAVALYIKLGKRVKATIRELGYPTKNALKSWYREYERHQNLRMASAPRSPKFSEEQKKVALEHYASQGRCISWTMRALGYPGRATLTAWVHETFPEAKRVSNGRYGPGNHTDAVKQAAVVGLYCREESAEALAKKVGVSRPTLYAWKTQFLGAEAPATMRRKKSPPLDPEIAELERQRDALQHAIRELQCYRRKSFYARNRPKAWFGARLKRLPKEARSKSLAIAPRPRAIAKANSSGKRFSKPLG